MQTGRLPKITLAAIVGLPMAAKNSKLEHLKEDIAALSSSFLHLSSPARSSNSSIYCYKVFF
jgi:hypothetical protein